MTDWPHGHPQFQNGRIHLLAVEHPAVHAVGAHQLGRLGANYRGHEFHYASEVERSGSPLFRARCARGQDLGEQGCRSGHVVGSFLHLIDRAAGPPPVPRSA